MKRLIPKFSEISGIYEMYLQMVKVCHWRTANKWKKSAKFVNVSAIILINCRFVSENNLHLASSSPRRK